MASAKAAALARALAARLVERLAQRRRDLDARDHRAVGVGGPRHTEVDLGTHHATNPHNVRWHGEVAPRAGLDAEAIHDRHRVLVRRVRAVEVLVRVDAPVGVRVRAAAWDKTASFAHVV